MLPEKFTKPAYEFKPKRAIVPTRVNGRTNQSLHPQPDGKVDSAWNWDFPERGEGKDPDPLHLTMNYTELHDASPLPLYSAEQFDLIDFLCMFLETGKWADSLMTFDEACRGGLMTDHVTELRLAQQYMHVRKGGEFTFGILHGKWDVLHRRGTESRGRKMRQQHKTVKSSSGKKHAVQLTWGEGQLYHCDDFDEAVVLKKDAEKRLTGYWELPKDWLRANRHVCHTDKRRWPKSGASRYGKGYFQVHEPASGVYNEAVDHETAKFFKAVHPRELVTALPPIHPKQAPNAP